MQSANPGKRLQRSKTRSPLANERVTLGLFVDWAIGDYQEAIIQSVIEAARKRGANLLCFAGGSIAKDGSDPRNSVFSLAGAENLDALILASAGLGNIVGPAGVTQFCKQFEGIPIVSMTAELGEAPHLLVDNAAGMRALVHHLVTVHGHRRIAFIGGARENVESEGRYQAYRAVLTEHGIPIPEQLILAGEFGITGDHAIRMLFDERHVRLDTLDAIVASNDSAALTALRELERRGVRVPEDVVLTGFDDNEHIRYVNPPLTTVRQPISELGTRAVQVAMDLINDTAVPRSAVLPTELVVRASCGCFARSSDVRPAVSLHPTPRQSLEAALIGRRSVILAEIARTARATLGAAGAGWEERVFNGLVANLRDGTGSLFLRALDQVMSRVLAAGADVRILYEVTAALRRQVIPLLEPASEERDRAEILFQEATRVVADALERVQVNRNIELKFKFTGLAGAMAGLSTWHAGRELGRWVASQLPQLDVALCHVSVFENPEDRTRAHMILAYDAARTQIITEAQGEFPAKNLIPLGLPGQDRAAAMLVVPLFFEGETLGFMMMDIGRCEPSTFYALPAMVSALLHRARGSGPKTNPAPRNEP